MWRRRQRKWKHWWTQFLSMKLEGRIIRYDNLWGCNTDVNEHLGVTPTVQMEEPWNAWIFYQGDIFRIDLESKNKSLRTRELEKQRKGVKVTGSQWYVCCRSYQKKTAYIRCEKYQRSEILHIVWGLIYAPGSTYLDRVFNPTGTHDMVQMTMMFHLMLHCEQ